MNIKTSFESKIKEVKSIHFRECPMNDLITNWIKPLQNSLTNSNLLFPDK